MSGDNRFIKKIEKLISEKEDAKQIVSIRGQYSKNL